MQPAPFEYHRPSSLDEALDALSSVEDARPLAGGQSLLPMMKLRMASPPALVDLGAVDALRGIRRDGDDLVLGAMTRYVDVLRSGDARDACPVLGECVGVIGDVQVRNVGTVGGSVAHMDPASDLPTVLLALNASIGATGPDGERTLPAGDFFHGLFATALEDGELVTSLRIPAGAAAGEGKGAAYLKHPHPASRYAVAGAAAVISLEGGVVRDVSLAVGGVTGGPVLVEGAADALAGREPEEGAIRSAAEAVAGALGNPLDDTYASGEYRVHLAGVLARRALAKAVRRARGDGDARSG